MLEDWMIPLFFAKITRALTLIGERDPRRLRLIQRDVRVIVGEPGGNSYWYGPLRMVAMSWGAVLPISVARTAMTIVHEATHARIDRMGIRYTAELRPRIETACVEQEAAFARRLPGGDALAERELAKLAEPWWTPEALSRSSIVRARAHGVPEWLIRKLERRHATAFGPDGKNRG